MPAMIESGDPWVDLPDYLYSNFTMEEIKKLLEIQVPVSNLYN
jgi:hypothetical protein